MRSTLLLFVAPFAMAACVDASLPDGLPDPDPDPTPDPTPDPEPEPEPAPLACDGSYWIESQLDVQAAAVLPQTAYDAVELLRGLRDEPGRTLFDLAEEAGVPAVEEIRDALPSYLEDRLYGWIDGQLASYTHAGTPTGDVLTLVLGIAETAIADVELSSELSLEGGATVHQLREVGFAIAGHEARYDVTDLPLLDLTESPTATITQIEGGARLALGAHAYGLPYGELALRAIEDVLVAELGADLRGTLGLLVDCPQLAADIAAKCYWGQCVEHEPELLAVCEGGLDYLAAEIRGRIAEVRFDAITLDAGTATLVSTDGDDTADAIVGGVWTAHIDAGMGPRLAPGTFAGSR